DNAEEEQPFFLMVSWPDPHHPFNPPGKYWDLYDPLDMPLPRAFEKNDWTPPPHVAGVLRKRKSGKANLTGMNAIGCSAREAQEAQALTCGMITMIDDALGKVVASLEKSGRSDETVQIFTSDHGDHLGDHRLLFKGAEQYEQITRVPFIWSDPEGQSRIRTNQIGQTHDIGGTILERAGIEAAWGMQSVDLFGKDQRKSAFIQYAHQLEMDELGVPPHVHSIHDGRYRLSVFQDMEWGELYDLHSDPGEFNNLWDHSEMREIKTHMLECLVRAEIDSVETSPLPRGRA
ncbi:MAG: sulfatase-like hydrolase/transferase, partial [Pseudomonadota bacterium]